MPTPSEIYYLPAVTGNTVDQAVLIHRLLPDELQPYFKWEDASRDTDLRTVVHGYHYEDYERYAVLASYWYDDTPFAILESAGRGGDDYVRFYVTDRPLRARALEFAAEFLCDLPATHVFHRDVDIPDLGRFYGQNFFPGKPV